MFYRYYQLKYGVRLKSEPRRTAGSTTLHFFVLCVCVCVSVYRMSEQVLEISSQVCVTPGEQIIKV